MTKAKRRRCDRCDEPMMTHKYDEYLCSQHFYEAWAERHGYEVNDG